jgi:hypothetical protein
MGKIIIFSNSPHPPSVPTISKGSIWKTLKSFSSETKRKPLKKSETIIRIMPTAYPFESTVLLSSLKIKLAAPTKHTPENTRPQPK